MPSRQSDVFRNKCDLALVLPVNIRKKDQYTFEIDYSRVETTPKCYLRVDPQLNLAFKHVSFCKKINKLTGECPCISKNIKKHKGPPSPPLQKTSYFKLAPTHPHLQSQTPSSSTHPHLTPIVDHLLYEIHQGHQLLYLDSSLLRLWNLQRWP